MRFLLAGFLMLAPAAARAELFTIPLPLADGTVGCNGGCFSGLLPFHLPGVPAVVRGAMLHVTGNCVVGLIQCDDVPGSPPYPWVGRVEGVMNPGKNQFWDALAQGMPTVSGPFDVSAPFHGSSIPPTPAPDWSFLSSGTGQVELGAGPEAMLLGCFSVGPVPTVSLTGAWIVVDADIPVAAHGASWGRVKGIYR